MDLEEIKTDNRIQCVGFFLILVPIMFLIMELNFNGMLEWDNILLGFGAFCFVVGVVLFVLGNSLLNQKLEGGLLQ